MPENAELGLMPPMPTPEAIAALRREPRFKEAIAAILVSSIEFYQRGWLANRVLNDRARFILATVMMFLHFSYRPEIANSGLTAARLREICVGTNLCGGGRVESLLLMMRVTGHLVRAEASERRVRRYVPGAKLIKLHRARQRQVLSALDILRGDTRYLARFDEDNDDGFYPRFVSALGRGFLSGFRIVNAAPELQKMVDRDTGLPLMICVLLASARYAELVPEDLRPVSVAALARRFKVSRIQVRSVLRGAESSHFLIRHGDAVPVTALPGLNNAIEKFFANALIFSESCAKIALAQEA